MSIARRYGRVGNEIETVSVSRKAPKSQSQSHGETDEIANLKARVAELERHLDGLSDVVSALAEWIGPGCRAGWEWYEAYTALDLAPSVTQSVTRNGNDGTVTGPVVTPTVTDAGAVTPRDARARNAERQRRYRERKKAAQS